MGGKGIEWVAILGWRERSDRSEVVGYKGLKGLEELDGGVVRPDIGKVVLKVIDQFGGSVMGTVVPDAEYGGIGSVRVGLNKGVWCEESVGRIDYQVKREDDFFVICSPPLEVVFGTNLNRAGFGEC